MMKKVNRRIAGMTMKRYAGATGKKSFFTLLSAPRRERAAVSVSVRWEGSAVAVMPAS
jgi:hypothetical protein